MSAAAAGDSNSDVWQLNPSYSLAAHFTLSGPTARTLTHSTAAAGWRSVSTLESFARGVCEYEVRINNKTTNMMFGLTPTCGLATYPGQTANTGVALSISNGHIFHNATSFPYVGSRVEFVNGTVVRVIVDFGVSQLRFIVTPPTSSVGVDLGLVSSFGTVAFAAALYPAVSFYEPNGAVTLLSVKRSYAVPLPVLPPPNDFVTRPKELWRQLVNKLKDLPERRINILLLGAIGSGKSAIINTLLSAFRETDTIVRDAESFAKATGHVTTKLKHWPMDGSTIMLWDTWGWTPTNYDANVFPRLLDGHLGSDFAMAEAVAPGKQHYNLSPSTLDRVHAVILVVDVNTIRGSPVIADKDKIADFVTHMHARNLRPIIFLNKLDDLDSSVASAPETVYSSRVATEERLHLRGELGFAINDIFPIKSYTSEMNRKEELENGLLVGLLVAVRTAQEVFKKQAATDPIMLPPLPFRAAAPATPLAGPAAAAATWRCTLCMTENRDGAACSRCTNPKPATATDPASAAAAVARGVCAHCSKANATDAIFCNNCGRRM